MDPLGANVGFGYLGDDDDDAETGGAGADTFDAVFASYDTDWGINVASTFTLACVVGVGAQTLGSVRVSVEHSTTTGVAPVTVDLDGWTETGWTSDLSDRPHWYNTLTRASLAVGTTGPSFSFSYTTTGVVTVSTADVAPTTAEATGGGATVTTTLHGEDYLEVEAEFSAVVASPSEPSAPFADPILCTITAAAAQVGQTDGSIYVEVSDDDAGGVIASIATTDLDGWSETGWSAAAGIWTNRYTKAVVSIGTREIDFTITAGLETGLVTVKTVAGVADPSTAEDSLGLGNTMTVSLV